MKRINFKVIKQKVIDLIFGKREGIVSFKSIENNEVNIDELIDKF